MATSFSGFSIEVLDIDLSSLAFFDIPDARLVYQIVQSQREQATTA
jgi:hypothetical protein